MPDWQDCPLQKDEFRLFRLIRPAIHTRTISVEIKPFNVYHAPKYTAISYCWGELVDGLETIRCDGKPFQARRNLFDALHRFQHDEMYSWLWADAICIRQGEDDLAVEEKKQQIAFMETIFASAETVWIWLGGASDAEEKAFGELTDIFHTYEHLRKPDIDLSQLPSVHDPIWNYWAQVVLRRWFSRIWTFQEAVLCTGVLVVVLGMRITVSWHTFIGMILICGRFQAIFDYAQLDHRSRLSVQRHCTLQDKGMYDYIRSGTPDVASQHAMLICYRSNPNNIGKVRRLRLHRSRSSHPFSLFEVIVAFDNHICTHPQDRPNAMRGVLPEEFKTGLRVFSLQDDVATVYRDTSRQWLLNDQTLSLLQLISPLPKFLGQYRSGYKSGSTIKNPSWVMDLRWKNIHRLPRGTYWKGLDEFHAGLTRIRNRSGQTSHWTTPNEVPRGLIDHRRTIEFPDDAHCRIEGMLLGIVTRVVARLRRSADSKRGSNADCVEVATWVIESWKLISGMTPTVGNATNITRHCRALVLDRTSALFDSHPEIDQDDTHERRDGYEGTVKILAQTTESSSPASALPDPIDELTSPQTKTGSYYKSMYQDYRNIPNWYRTDTGLIGRSRAIPQQGDAVVVFLGAATTYLLRPAGNVRDEEAFEFMCESYTHGCMQGEAFLPENEGNFQRRSFLLV